MAIITGRTRFILFEYQCSVQVQCQWVVQSLMYPGFSVISMTDRHLAKYQASYSRTVDNEVVGCQRLTALHDTLNNL